jgi:hypothetical protein
MYSSWRLSGSYAAADWVGRSIGQIEHGGVDPLRHALLVAVPAFHANIVWMYREDYDRAGYFVLPQSQARDRFVVLQTILPLLALLPVIVLLAGDEPAKHPLLHGSVAPEFRVLLLRGTIRALQIHRVCASTACCIDHLPSIIIRTDEFS